MVRIRKGEVCFAELVGSGGRKEEKERESREKKEDMVFRSKRAERTKSDRKFRLIEMAFRLITNHISDVARETVGELGGGGGVRGRGRRGKTDHCGRADVQSDRQCVVHVRLLIGSWARVP